VYYTHGGHNGAMDKRDDKRNQLDRCNNNNGQAYPRIERELQPARIHYTALHCTAHTHTHTHTHHHDEVGTDGRTAYYRPGECDKTIFSSSQQR